MNMKKSWSPIKEMLFTYLAIIKILSWISTINTIDQSSVESVGEAIIARLLYQDIVLIVSVVFFYFLDKRTQLKKSRYSKVLEYIVFYVIGLVVLVGFVLVYNRVVFGPIQVDSWIGYIGGYVLGYAAIVAVLNIKEYFKTKAKLEYDPVVQNTDKFTMLKILYDGGILTKEEYEQKSEILLNLDSQ